MRSGQAAHERNALAMEATPHLAHLADLKVFVPDPADRRALRAVRGPSNPTRERTAYTARGRGRLRPAPMPGYPGPMHDENYKRLFAFPRMVEDLLRGFVPGDWTAELDFSTLEKLSAEFVSDALRKRHGDTVWRVRHRHGWLHVLVLLEFQSTDEPRMALRILTYTSLLYQELARNEALGPDGRLPAVLPVVLYNGASRWTAAVEVGELIGPVGPWLAPYQPSQRYFVLDERHVGDEALPAGNLMTAVVGLERSRSPADLKRVVEALVEWLRDPYDDELKHAFADWVWRLARRFTPGDAEPPPVRTLEGVKMTLEERVAEWPKQWLREGREQGLEQGLEHERALLRRMAASRFGTETAERLSGVLAGIGDPEALAEVGDWLVRCDTGSEFLARVAPVADGPSGRTGPIAGMD